MPAPPALSKKTLLGLVAALASLLAVFGVTVVVNDPDQPVPPIPAPSASPTPTASPTPGNPFPPIDPCVRPAGMTGLRDQDPSDSQRPWRRPGAGKAVITIDASKVAGQPEWMDYLNGAAKKWNVSPCVDVRVVTSCPAKTACVSFALKANDDGNFDAVESGGFTVGGAITVDPKLKGARLAPDLSGPCSQRFNVTIHEIGHSIALAHVKTKNVIMNEDTYSNVCSIDQGALDNLAWSYTALQGR